MGTDYKNYINQLDEYKPIKNSFGEDDWIGLEEILDSIYEANLEEKCLNSMFKIFERYPCEDNDLLWGMLHGIEAVPNYENELLESIERQPSFFTTLMINRILNANISQIEGRSLMDILTKIQADFRTPTYVKECTERWIERQE